MSSSDDSDIQRKMGSNDEMNYSDIDKLIEEKSNKNAEMNQKKEEDTKEDAKEIKPAIKENDESDEDSSDSSRKNKKQNKEKGNIKEDKKEEKKENKKSKNDSSSSSSSSSVERKINRQKKLAEIKEKEEKERQEKLRKNYEENEKKEKEKEKEKEMKDENKKVIEENKFRENKNEETPKIRPKININKNENPSWRRNDDNFPRNNNNNFNNNPNANQQNSYIKKRGKKYDLNEEKILKNIISDNSEIIDKMKNAYPGIPKLDCAYILKKLKVNTSSPTLFEIMNKIHRDISTELTLNRSNEAEKKYLLQIDPYEIIDTLYNSSEHVNTMKFYKIYSSDDKKKLPPYLQESLPSNFYYDLKREKEERRRKLVKYIDGSFNYIPVTCPNIKRCLDNNCPYSHNDNENNYHPLYYKTILMNNLRYNNDSKMIKNSCDLFTDFRIIYNYKDENIINLMKLIEEKKIAKTSFRDYLKNKISSFSLNTFKILECPSIKAGMKCPKSDPHLCYYYHDISERRRPPTLYRYINEMCPNQIIKKGKIKEKCIYGDFCNKCHSKYECYYHSLFYGKAMTCIRPKKFGKCIFEETCYAYHPYKEPGYKKTKEEIIKERKDEKLQKLMNDNKSLNSLIEKFRCPKCGKFKNAIKYCLLLNCQHIICSKCFKEEKKCPKCNKKIKRDKEGEDFILMDIASSSVDIDKLVKNNYEKKKGKEKNAKNKENEKINKEEIKEDQKEEIKKDEEKEENEDNDNNCSM